LYIAIEFASSLTKSNNIFETDAKLVDQEENLPSYWGSIVFHCYNNNNNPSSFIVSHLAYNVG